MDRAIRLIRNTLMSALNIKLQLPTIVWDRWPQAITVFQPEIDAQNVQRIWGARIALLVKFNEFSPLAVGDVIEEIGITVKRKETGEIYFEAEFT